MRQKYTVLRSQGFGLFIYLSFGYVCPQSLGQQSGSRLRPALASFCFWCQAEPLLGRKVAQVSTTEAVTHSKLSSESSKVNGKSYCLQPALARVPDSLHSHPCCWLRCQRRAVLGATPKGCLKASVVPRYFLR